VRGDCQSDLSKEIQLEQVLSQDTIEDFTCKVAKTLEEDTDYLKLGLNT